MKTDVSRHISQRRKNVPLKITKSFVPDYTFKDDEKLYIKRDVENANEVVQNEVVRNLKGMFSDEFRLRDPTSLHVTVLNSKKIDHLRTSDVELKEFVSLVRQASPQLFRPTSVTFDRIVSDKSPVYKGRRLFYLGYDLETRTALDIETEVALKSIGQASGYSGIFYYMHDPHITIASSKEVPGRGRQEILLDKPITAHLSKAAFFLYRVA